ncbi:uncharacterized protein B0H18DRAFT_1081399 [Fomitopsis serialis]|uniref:uncharacterized protein n=1 Tax=Fomitopsis serialis TaxID=139415 RepID=UPI0020083700|nr:uncharacterized protein B0H18DRAFT_1081399 [Neoantrodia serialis]KAH9937132.1 hypothetical protein B0H18DRAFT_1081399 [Neoantrodia serialis]
MSNPATISDCKCVLVIGATAGIGRDLALAIHGCRPSRPSSRREAAERLDDFDVNASRDALKSAVQDVYQKYPDLDAVLFKPESVNLERGAEHELHSITRMVTFFLPHFLKLSVREGRPSLMITVTSGLAIFTLSLYTQLRDTKVKVMEIFPPLVESELHDRSYYSEVSKGLKRGDVEIPVGMVKQQWETFESGKLEKVQNTMKLFRSRRRRYVPGNRQIRRSEY